ncbi:ankyrin repeat protein [Necator americanus]|uniref:Ankyrin repeat protein n=1 Tax=Necator americanus TaxID=51031 RepID=W2T713_NECAM|nr:ankyrin repeat protein [Necator americanus]ETN77673.1 ankyrin repeat protein [Necator americanus]
MPAFEQTKVAAEAFAKLICCANPEWDCINSYSSMNTLVLCPMCACPLEVNHPKAAIIFNNLAHHINDFRLLLDEYEKCLANEGEVTAAGTIAQTQALLKGHDFASADEVNQTARNNSPASDFSEELNLTPPPTNPHLTADVNDGQIRANSQTVVEFAECFDRLSDEDLACIIVLREDGIITDSAPQFDQPLMSSTQRPNLFLSQALHARNEMFQKEATQTEAPWLDLLRRGRTNVPPKTTLKIEIQEGEEFVVPSTSVQDDRVTPKRGPKVEISSSSRGRKSSFSTPRPYSRIDDPVMDAVISGELDQVKSAIEAGHDVNNRDQQKRTPLFVAVEMKRLDICKVLVERGGAVINANCGPDCNTALHVAVAQGNEEIARYLLSKGASKTVCNGISMCCSLQAVMLTCSLRRICCIE